MNVSKEAREACAAYASPSTYQPGDGEKYGERLPLVQAFAKFEAEITQRIRDEALEEAASVIEAYPGRDFADITIIRGCAAAIRQMIGGKA